MKQIKMAMLLLLFSVLTGCANNQAVQPPAPEEPVITSMEEEPDLSYEIPDSVPGILVNQLGYIRESTKVAIFRGRELPETFQVINADTGKTVFTGTTKEEEYHAATDEYNGYGDFSVVQTPGTYYIEAPFLGRSYSFVIGEGLYDQVFREACKQYYYNRCGITLTEEYAGERAHNACHTGKALLREDISVSMDVSGGWHQDQKGSKDVALAAKNMGIMLLSYELYQDSFTDAMGIPESGNGIPDILDEIRYEAEWLLKMQDPAVGGVYGGVTVYDPGPGKPASAYVEPVSVQASRAFAMVMAKFSYLYQYYDTAYATNCLKAADRAWKYAELWEETPEDPWQFAAAAELYRASGLQSCHAEVTEYLKKGTYKKEMDEIVFMGCVTYLSTKQKVNVEICEDVIKTLMERAENIAAESQKSFYGITENGRAASNEELLLDMMYLTTADYVISNHEYETIIEDHLHYFMGRNAQAVSYIDNVGQKNYRQIDESMGIMKQFDADSKLIFMLGEIVGSHKK